jgi:squalene-hopene/tetraprenyl-beta-curcumene cyclase
MQDGTLLDWRAELARKLIAIQRIEPDSGHGYWLNDNGRFWENDPVLATAYCLLALELL